MTNFGSNPKLYQRLDEWKFYDELTLEDFIWNNLNEILNLIPLKRQFIINTERCDILAVDQDRKLNILELKNVEDRYVIQQLTRYYDALLKEKPFEDEIDYSQGINLIVLSPEYHYHNFVDIKYSKINFQLLKFKIEKKEISFYFHLQDTENNLINSVPISSQVTKLEANAYKYPLPDLLKSWLMACSEKEQTVFFQIREKILSSDFKIKEIVEGNHIFYGFNKTKLIAEISLYKKYSKPILFLWLPTPITFVYPKEKIAIGRLRIWIDQNKITHVGHTPKDLGKMMLEEEWSKLPPNKKPKSMFHSLSSKSHTPVTTNWYFQSFPEFEESNTIQLYSDLAIKMFLERNSL